MKKFINRLKKSDLLGSAAFFEQKVVMIIKSLNHQQSAPPHVRMDEMMRKTP